jgi:hypothetical protein
MVTFFSPQVRDATTGELNAALVGVSVQIRLKGSTTPSSPAGTPVAILEYPSGAVVPDSRLTVSARFSLTSFSTPDGVYEVEAVSDDGTVTYLFSAEGLVRAAEGSVALAQQALLAAQAARDAAQAAAAGGGGSGTTVQADWNANSGPSRILNKPSTFPPSTHSHTTADLSIPLLAKQLLDAAVAGGTEGARAMREVLGAGTGNGTSNLVIGTSATTAAAGSHTHSAGGVAFTPGTLVTATNVQAAIEQAASMGGSAVSGAGAILVIIYRAGAYPAVPTTRPSGINVVLFLGPTQPTSVPSWIGLAANQAVPVYFEVPTT